MVIRERGSHEQLHEVEEKKISTEKLKASKGECLIYFCKRHFIETILHAMLYVDHTREPPVKCQDDQAPEIPNDAFAGLEDGVKRMNPALGMDNANGTPTGDGDPKASQARC